MTGGRVLSLYLVRHAQAEPRGPRWPDDSHRPLAGRGRQRFASLLLDPAVRRASLDVVLTSPFVRAVQTAEMLAKARRSPLPVRVCLALEPGGRPEAVARAVARRPNGSAVALVGHEPALSQFVAYLTGRPAPIPFRKGGVWRLRVRTPVAAGSGRLVWARWPGPSAVRVVMPS